jgi:hypothetical protein
VSRDVGAYIIMGAMSKSGRSKSGPSKSGPSKSGQSRSGQSKSGQSNSGPYSRPIIVVNAIGATATY